MDATFTLEEMKRSIAKSGLTSPDLLGNAETFRSFRIYEAARVL